MAAERGANAREKLLDAEGLGDVVVGASIEGDDFVALGTADGKHDDGSVGGAANFAARFNATDAGKVHVEQNEVGLLPADEIDGFFAGGGFEDDIAAKRKSGPKGASDLGFVVDN
jgi:hypothetical protein